MNTDISTSVMPMIGPNNSSIALIAASCGVRPRSSVVRHAFHNDDGVVHHDADGQDDGEQRRKRLTVKPKPHIAAKAPMIVTGTVVAQHQASLASPARNTRITISTRRAASPSVL